jgi:hypothetical protein
VTARSRIAFGVLTVVMLAVFALYFSGVWTVHT